MKDWNVPDQNTEKKKRGPLVHAFIEFCPHWIYTKDDKNKVITKIHWRNVINTRTKRSNSFLFTFVKEGQSHTTKYEIITKDMSKIMMLMNQMINIFQILIAEQQRLEKRIREEMQLLIEGGWVDENEVVHNAMIDLFCASDLAQERIKKLKWFDLDSKYEDVKACLMEEFKLQPEVKQRNTYGLTIRSPDGEIKWLEEEQRLADIKPHRKSAIYIFSITPIIKVKSPQGVYKTIIIDISHPLRKVSKYIANKFNTTTFLSCILFCIRAQSHSTSASTGSRLPSAAARYSESTPRRTTHASSSSPSRIAFGPTVMRSFTIYSRVSLSR